MYCMNWKKWMDRQTFFQSVHVLGKTPEIPIPALENWNSRPEITTMVKGDGLECYESILTYVDDCLVVSGDPNRTKKSLEDECKYHLKDVAKPKHYLGAEIGR
jgi:hypothetical protein